MEKPKKFGFEELCLYAGKPEGMRSHNVPIDNSASWEIRSEEELEDGFAGKIPVYARISSHGNIAYVEKKICAMETLSMDGGGAKARMQGSGMAAVTALLFGATDPGDSIIVVGPVYGGTYELLKILKANGRYVEILAARQEDFLEELEGKICQLEPKIVFGEMTCNPTIDVWDAFSIAEICGRKSQGSIFAVDTSFSSPYNARPFGWGADIVIHSATKYLGAHGAFVAGLIVASPKLVGERADIWAKMNNWMDCSGAVPAEKTASELGLFMETLFLRIPDQNANALILASWLSKHKKVLSVNYPVFDGRRELVNKLICAPGSDARDENLNFGGMLSFRVKGGAPAARKFVFEVTANTLLKNKPSLGYTKTIFERPRGLSHAKIPAALSDNVFGITEDMIRVSLGVESPGYILDAFEFGLKKI